MIPCCVHLNSTLRYNSLDFHVPGFSALKAVFTWVMYGNTFLNKRLKKPDLKFSHKLQFLWSWVSILPVWHQGGSWILQRTQGATVGKQSPQLAQLCPINCSVLPRVVGEMCCCLRSRCPLGCSPRARYCKKWKQKLLTTWCKMFISKCAHNFYVTVGNL